MGPGCNCKGFGEGLNGSPENRIFKKTGESMSLGLKPRSFYGVYWHD